MIEQFGKTALLAIAISFFAGYFIIVHLSQSKHNALVNLPWVNVSKGPFSRTRARFNPASQKEAIGEAFKRACGRMMYFIDSFVYLSFLSKPKIILPPSQAQWLIDQPDDVLSFVDALSDEFSLYLTFQSPLIPAHPLHHDVIKGVLTRSLAKTSSVVLDEIQASVSNYWGDDQSQWSEVVALESLIKIFAQISARVFVGAPLCRNREFLDAVVEYADSIILVGMKLRLAPQVLKEIFGPYMTGSVGKAFDKIYSHVGPVIEERKAHMSQKQADPRHEWEEPFDLLQWMINRACRTGDSAEFASEMICKRLAVVFFAAIHTTSLTTMHLLFDLLSMTPEQGVIKSLREEILEVQRSLPVEGNWDKASLAKLVRLDSAIRESQRMNGSGVWALSRKVRAREGLRLHDGLVAPHGSHVAISAYHLQRDPRVYENPDFYDPFRFSRPQQTSHQSKDSQDPDNASASDDRGRLSRILNERNAAAVSTGLTHLAFGHGRHACPGRFFAIQEVKLLAIHVLMSYDLKPLERRPEGPWYGDLMTPDMKATIFVRNKNVTGLDSTVSANNVLEG